MFKPLLAAKLTKPQTLRFPVLASPKLDGVRCIIRNGVAMSRNLKPIPNLCVSDILRDMPPFDGELIVGPVAGQGVFNRTSSGVMSAQGMPKFTYHVFDVMLKTHEPFQDRLALAAQWARSTGSPGRPNKVIKCVPHELVKNLDQLYALEQQYVEQGFEGLMLRSLDGPYKFGRSTEREGTLLKLKRFEDGEAVVLSAEEKMHNDNELTQDELGRAKRSSHKAGKRAAGVLGAFVVKDVLSGAEFSVGAGYTDQQREAYWKLRYELTGNILKYRYQPSGVKDKPRFPTFIGFRDGADM